ncbi:MAG TPA: alpha/beta fold hydrolase [Steroidobacteraceae bacterium]|nr:alpha/beta fold hydrolase [Steroidobacteraceae bacterium]
MAGQPPEEAGARNAPQSLRLPHVSPGHLAWLRKVFALLQAVSPALAARAAFYLFLRTFRHPVRPEDAAALARARRHRLMAGPDPFEVYEWGSGDRTVIILHGWGSNAARFVGLAEALQARGWHVLVPDAPGHGASPGRSSSLPQFVAALDAVVARFGPPRALIGHSLGALGIAHRHADGAPDWAGALSSVVLVSMPSGAPFLVEVFLNALGIRAATRTRLETLFRRRFDADVAGFGALPGAARIPARLLLVHDSGDDVVPHVHASQLLEQLPQAEVVTTSQLGHSALTRDAATIERIVQFVEQES